MRYLILITILISGCGLAQSPEMQKQVKACMDSGKIPVYSNNGFVVFFTCVDQDTTVNVD